MEMDEKTKMGLVIAGIVAALGVLAFSLKQSFFSGPAPVPQSEGAKYGAKMKQSYAETARKIMEQKMGNRGGTVGTAPGPGSVPTQGTPTGQ
jgi:hypothetical protein